MECCLVLLPTSSTRPTLMQRVRTLSLSGKEDLAFYCYILYSQPLSHVLCYTRSRVVDDSGEPSNIASVTLQVQDCNLIDIFQVPSTYPVFSGSYNYVHVSEDGPNLDNVKTPAHRVQWQNPGLYQFSLELTVEPYYLDVVGCMTNQALSGSGASFTLSGCGISELDGDYWIAQQDGNEIWVEKNNGWALVFTNDASYAPEFCRSPGPPPPTTSNPTTSPTKKPTDQPTNVSKRLEYF